MKNHVVWLIIGLFAICGIIGVISVISIISSDLQLIQIVLLIILNGITFSITLWTAFFSPQAIYARIQKNEYANIKRQEHYKRLRENIFKPLSSIIASITLPSAYLGSRYTLDDKLILNYDITHIIHNPMFGLALHHLNKDFSNMGKEILSLNDRIKRYNEETGIFIKNTTNDVSEKISKFAAVVDELPLTEGQVYFPLVEDFLMDEWWSILHKYCELKRPLNQILNEIKPLDKSEKIYSPGGEIIINTIPNRVIMNGITPEKVNEILSIIEFYRANKDIILKLTEITNSQQELIEKSKEIADKCKEVSDLVLKGGYETIADCCSNEKILKDF
jgi:hypothetical protein